LAKKITLILSDHVATVRPHIYNCGRKFN